MDRSHRLAFWSVLLALLAFGLTAADPAFALIHRHHGVPALRGSSSARLHRGPARALAARGLTARLGGRITPMPMGATDPDKDAALIVDGSNGKTLYARNETALRHPASLTKMMTLYLLFDALRAHRITMDTPMPVSVHASVQKPTKLSLRPGQTINVDTAIRAIVIRSANDVAVVIAEALGGTEGHFAEMMTQKAHQLGMKDTNYHNASGLPDPLQITTANDLAILAHHLGYDFPQYFPFFSLPGFNYKGVYYPTHDNLIGRYQGADGIKTGYTGASGFNLASSVERGGVHLIGIVMGGRTAVRRDMEMMHLLDTEFAAIDGNPTLVARAPVPWQNVAAAQPVPAPIGPQYNPNQFAALSAMPPATPANEDEDAAEARRAPDENFSVIHAEAPQLASVAKPVTPVPSGPTAVPSPALDSLPAVPAVPPLASKPPAPKTVVAGTPAPAIRPLARPDAAGSAVASAGPAKSARVAALNHPAPALRPDIGEGDVDQPGVTVPGHNWTIQIGAYADQTLAKAELATYAQKAQDVLGQAARIIAPITKADGHILYRARFGLYAEREARQVCDRLTQRGQTCFAAITTR
jgi:D-alanyl-D-alanine carboxypeptidase